MYQCKTEQNIDQFLHVRGNGRIVLNCLTCRHKDKLHVISLFTVMVVFSSANLLQVEASRASIEISRAIARGENSLLAFAPALAPGPQRNLTHGVLATMYHERGRVPTDTPGSTIDNPATPPRGTTPWSAAIADPAVKHSPTTAAQY
jgi:hypothetical protein